MVAFDAGLLELHSEVMVRNEEAGEGWIQTTPGRIIFNEVLPVGVRNYGMVMDKKALKDLVTEVYRRTGNETTAEVLDSLKSMGFHYATISGTTIGITDIKVPPEKAVIVAAADKEVEELEEQYEMGLITEREKRARAVAAWQRVSIKMDEVIQRHLPEFGGIYAMAHSGARGNEAQIKQMAVMRGLMSNPRGDIIELPIRSSFREGLSVLEYFISTHGARKGLADTALRTADSGYLTRRLIDVAQEVIVLLEDCGTDRGIRIYAEASEEDVMIGRLSERIVGRMTSAPIADPNTGEVLLDAGVMVEESQAEAVEAAGVTTLRLRSPLTCEALRGICQACYGRSLATGKTAFVGDAVGIIAAQSIGEPGTQLTMRTFHTGGIAGKDITSGLPRVEEIFEARSPKGKSRIAEIDGEVLVFEGGKLVDDHTTRMGVGFSSGVYEGGKLVGESHANHDQSVLTPPTSFAPVFRVVSRMPFTDSYAVPETLKLTVKAGQQIKAGETVAEPIAEKPKRSRKKAGEVDAEPAEQMPASLPLLARVSGQARLVEGGIEIDAFEVEVRDHLVDVTDQRLVRTGDVVTAGQKLTSGVKDPHDILRIEGMEATQRYLVEQVQTVYRNQGVSINDKHIETIIRQMLRWYRVESIGDTELLPNQLTDRGRFNAVNQRVMAAGGDPALGRPEIRGVTRASLSTDSFLAKASFQETARVLTEAAISGETDYLLGLKENVIIGRLIPARLDMSEQGRALLDLPELLEPGFGEKDDADDEIRSLIGDAPGLIGLGDNGGGSPWAASIDPPLPVDDEGDDDDDELVLPGDDDDDLAEEPVVATEDEGKES